jgi:hypothetical protein
MAEEVRSPNMLTAIVLLVLAALALAESMAVRVLNE